MMPLPWLQLIDAGLGIANFARGRKSAAAADEPPANLEGGGRAPTGLDARLAGVVVAALKEAFDRDSRRIEFERELADAERRRNERALKLELQRQAGEREIGRMRLIAGVAGAAWLGTLLLVARLAGSVGARVALGFGWLLLLGAIAASFTAQSRIAAAIDAQAAGDDRQSIRAGASGGVTLWLTICGLLLAGLAALIA
jgi:hypothetical protein